MATCPACGAELEAETVASVNADRRPDLRDAILDGIFSADLATTHSMGGGVGIG